MILDNNQVPIVSIVLPTYNRAYILSEAIQSVLRQTFADWELIIVDDGSTDTTREVVERFADPRIRYLKHEKNKGLAASRNTGIKNAHGVYIANLDSDDTWLPAKLEKEISVFKNVDKNVCVVYSGYERRLVNGTVSLLPPLNLAKKEGYIENELLKGNFISMQMAIIRKDAALRVGGFDEKIEALQDWEFWLRLAPTCEFRYVPEILTRGAVLEDSIARDQKKRLRAREMIFAKHEILFKKVPSVYAMHAFTLGRAFAIIGNTTKAFEYLRKAKKARPAMLRCRLALLVVHIGKGMGIPDLYRKLAYL